MDALSIAVPAISGPLAPLGITEAAALLESSFRMQLNFLRQTLDLPPVGNLHFIETPIAVKDKLPSDGYGYMDDESLVEHGLSPGQREVLCYERKHGFRRGETMSSVSRRRYRFAESTGPTVVQIIHYFPIQVHALPVSKAAKAVPRAMIAESAPQHLGLQPGAQNFPGAFPGQQYPAGYRPGMQPGAGKAPDDVPIPVGDGLDYISVREVALERYRKNHQYMAEILSPYAIAEIVKPKLFGGVDTAWIKSLPEKGGDDVSQLQEATERFQQRIRAFQEAEERLKNATGPEIDEIQHQLKQALAE
ncbi:hypothetical protein DFJ74DRAFT_663802 [Hyaloraphidium curvatum]|nr:hypothetical protein DFJ74DRAFT_663802 [Hyaloraphidium curvatum]